MTAGLGIYAITAIKQTAESADTHLLFYGYRRRHVTDRVKNLIDDRSVSGEVGVNSGQFTLLHRSKP